MREPGDRLTTGKGRGTAGQQAGTQRTRGSLWKPEVFSVGQARGVLDDIEIWVRVPLAQRGSTKWGGGRVGGQR